MSRTLFLTSILLFACDSDKGVTAFNSKPEASITSHGDGDEVLEGVLVILRGSASDANHGHDQLTATWYVGSEVVCEATVPESDGTVQCETTLLPTDSEVTLEVKDVGNATGSDSVSLTVAPTQAPEAMIVTPEASGIYYSDQLISFEGVISDEEDDADSLVAFWESGLDGVLTDVDAIPDSDGSLLGHGYLSEGEHAIELTVEDTTGKTDRASVIIDVGPPNSAPLCEITGPVDGSAGSQGDSVQFVATASDVDVPSDVLTVIWSSDEDGEIGSSVPNGSGAISFTYSDLSVNTHNVSMQVTDEVGATCTATIDYTVGTPPSVTIDTPIDGSVLNEGEDVLFSATVSDSQNQPEDVALDWSLNGVSVSSQVATSNGTAAFSDSSLTYGPYNLLVTATDTDGLSDSDQINFTINGLPTQPVVRIEPDPADTNDALTVVIDTPSTDPEGGTVNYTYEWLLGGLVQPAYTSSTVPSSGTNKNEQWTVRVTPNDGIADGLAGESTITIENTSPTLSALVITPTNNVTNDVTLTCAVVVTDPDEILTPTYEWSIGSTIVGSGATLDLSSAGAMPLDVITCSVSVVDGNGASASDSTTTTVENRAPSVTGATITPSTGVTTGTALTCAATVSDDDGESPTVSHEWTVGSNAYTGATLSLDNTMVSPGDGIAGTVSATDGYGGTASDFASVTVENTLPTVIASISANGTTNTGVLTCSATAADVDDAPSIPTLGFEWFDASGVSLGTSNPLQLDGSMAVDGDDVSCVATATDLSGDSASDTAIHTVTNTPPVVDSIAMTPGTIDATTYYVGCTPIGSDADGDTVTFDYAWYVDGVLQTTATSNTFLQNWVPEAEITCRAIPNDGKVDGAFAEVSVVVDNTPPVVDSVGLTPSAPYTNDTLTATAVLSDADVTQSVTGHFSWHVIDFASGTDTEVQSGPDNTLSGVTHFDRDDEVYVVVTPNDGVLDGTPVTATGITVLNTAPTAPNVSMSPNPASAGVDDLVCSIDTPSNDDDGDSVVYTYVWTDHSGAIRQTTTESAATSDTFTGSGTSGGIWTCDVTPYDGTAYGNGATTSTTVETACPGLDANITTQAEADSYFPCVELNSLSLHMTSAVTSVHLPNLVTVHNSIYFHANDDLDGVSLPLLETVGGYVYFYHNYLLTDVDLDSLQSVGEYLYFDANSTLETLGLDTDLGFVGEYSYFSNNSRLCVPDLDWPTISQDYHYDNGNLDCADLDGDGVAAWEDCDDNDATIYPFAGDTYGDGVDSDCDGLDCEAGSDGNAYFAACIDNSTSHALANQTCINSGYDSLTSIVNATEEAFVLNLFDNPSLATDNNCYHDCYWIGLEQDGTSWRWLGGEAFGYHNWDTGQPDNPAEECVWISASYERWHDESCNQYYNGFTCQKR